LFLGEEE
jgi:hypothetical protein